MIPSIHEIELALSRYFNISKHICMPASTIFFNHEIDFLAIRKSGYAIEVEIKRSVSDMKAESKKDHNHESNKIKELYFAFPDKIFDKCVPLVPEHAGILKIYFWGYWRVSLEKKPKPNPNARKLTESEINKVNRYSNYRIWSCKNTIVNLTNQVKHLKNDKHKKKRKD